MRMRSLSAPVLALALCALGAPPAKPVGPKVPYLLSWTPSPTPDVTGYWFYWRATNTVWADTRRWAVATNAAPFDLHVLGLPKGVYYVMMTATNKAGAESDPSPEAVWCYNNPVKPGAPVVQ